MHLWAETSLRGQATDWPILICVLGTFRLLKAGHQVVMRNAGKIQALLCSLALAPEHSISRSALLQSLWPDTETELAGPSLNNLIYTLRKLVADQLGGAPPLLPTDGYYRLNVEAGIGVDLSLFEARARAGEQQARLGDRPAALASYRAAVELYRGDLCGGEDVREVMEREHLRALYLALLARLADDAYSSGQSAACLEYSTRLLSVDPCREDVHRLVMRCYARQGERVQALRQYRLCETLLRAEFDAAPEHTTRSLYDQIRLDPDSL